MADTETLAPGPAEGTPTTPVQETEKETTEYVTLAEEDEPDDDGEEGEEAATEQPDAGKDGSHKSRPGSAKWRERAQRAERELAELRRNNREPAPTGEEDDLKEPKEADFDNWVAYQRALQQYDARKAIRDEDARKSQRDAKAHAEREHAERLSTYNRNLDQVRDRIPDFDRVLADAREMPVSDAAQELILESPKGPLLAYYLAKNPDKLAEINRMSPTSAAREIGRLEARIRTPKPAARTKASPPPRSHSGSASPPTKPAGEMSMAEFVKAREEGRI